MNIRRCIKVTKLYDSIDFEKGNLTVKFLVKHQVIIILRVEFKSRSRLNFN